LHWKSKPPLTIPQILAWADAHHERTGRWPRIDSGAVPESPDLTWKNIYWALWGGYRGLPGRSTLPQLLAKHRSVQYLRFRPPLTVKQILSWAEAHYKRTGQWPTTASGAVYEAAEEDWKGIDYALRLGKRGLAGKSTLRRLLLKHRGLRRNLTIERILAWADAHRKRTGRWPTVTPGAVHGVAGETWQAIDMALRRGGRGLPGGSSLAQLLDKQRGPRAKLVGRPTATRRALRVQIS
jgi:hypothetical protein